MASLRYPLLGGIKLIISLRMSLELTSFLLEKYPMYVGRQPEFKKYRSRKNFTRSAKAGKVPALSLTNIFNVFKQTSSWPEMGKEYKGTSSQKG